MIEFYEGLLGFSHLDDLALPGGVLKRFVLGNARLKLLVLEDVPKYPNAPGGPMGGVAGLRYLTVAVADVADTVEKCQAAGRPVPMPVFDHEPGVPVAIVEDPEGTWVELIQAIET